MLTNNNCFKFGYNGSWFNQRTSVTDQWQVEYKPVGRPLKSFKEECIATARLIKESIDMPIDLLLSGGLDSEFIANIFIEANIPFNAVIMRFNDQLNIHDISYAIKWCSDRNIVPQFMDLDIIDFYQNKYADYAAAVSGTGPGILPHLWLIDHCDNFVVMGAGDVFLYKNTQKIPDSITNLERRIIELPVYEDSNKYDNSWYYRESELNTVLYRHFLKNHRVGCPAFFQYTSEMVLAWLQEPEVIADVTNQSNNISTFNTKYKIYHRIYQFESRKKFNGLENLLTKFNFDKMKKDLILKSNGHCQTYRILYHELVKQLSGEIRQGDELLKNKGLTTDDK